MNDKTRIMTERKAGFYRVRVDSDWTIGLWRPAYLEWFVYGTCLRQNDLLEIDETWIDPVPPQSTEHIVVARSMPLNKIPVISADRINEDGTIKEEL